MTIEELKLVLEMVGTVSGDAKIIAIAWLSIDIIKLLIVVSALGAIVVFGAKLLMSFSYAGKAFNSINRILGYPGSDNPFYLHEFDAVVDAVRNLKDEK